MKHNGVQRGFSLIELVVVISILAILAGALIPRVTNRMAEVRDARRLRDMATLKATIDKYFADKGAYPAAQENAAYGGWDVSHDNAFIPDLVSAGYLTEVPRDPLNDDIYHYRYYVYDRGTAGCKGNTKFYVLGLRAFETADFAARNRGVFKCSGRNWADEFGWVTGGGTSQAGTPDAGVH